MGGKRDYPSISLTIVSSEAAKVKKSPVSIEKYPETIM